MKFSVVEIGYDRGQVDAYLADLAERLARVVAGVDAAGGVDEDLAAARLAARHLRDALVEDQPEGHLPSYRMERLIAGAHEEAAGILSRARAELTAAREEARLVRDRVYAEAMQARRDFEAALHARRMRAQQVDEILRDVRVVLVPAGPDQPDLALTTASEQAEPAWVPDRSAAQV
nr:ATPase [Micromonospora sp. DSM 115978]